MHGLSFTIIFAAALLVSLLLKFWLATRQMRHVATHRAEVPKPFDASIALDAHQRAADYTLAKGRFGLISTALGTALLLVWTLLGGLDQLNQAVLEGTLSRFGPMAYQLALLAAFAVISALIDLPLDLYGKFQLEERFGFNHMTWRLYISDAVKGALVGAVIGLPIAAAILWIMGATGRYWWVWAWGAWASFNLIAMFVYPTLIAPLFNKFEPLKDALLVSRIQSLMQRCGFKANGLFVMDGSKRSAHANAYFTGFGSSKRVVFFDTLLSQLGADELEAVLAHELGHFKHKHIVKRIASMFLISLAGFAFLGWACEQSWFYTGLGVQPSMVAPNNALALLLFLLVAPVFGFFLSPLMAQISRKHEFEADAFACQMADGSQLASALLKLHKDNAATLTPDPLYVRFYYSHPPASERLAALQRGLAMNAPAAAATT